MKKFILSMIALLMMFSNQQTANAQYVVGKMNDTLLLDPNNSITENYAKIDSLMSLHKEKNFAEYTIVIRGYYTNELGRFYSHKVGSIKVKGENNEYYRTISGQIIHALTELYSYSLDKPVNNKESYSYNNHLYHLYRTSSLYKKFYDKVIAETGLKDGGKECELQLAMFQLNGI